MSEGAPKFRVSYRTDETTWYTCTMPGVTGEIVDVVSLEVLFPFKKREERARSGSPPFLVISAADDPGVRVKMVDRDEKKIYFPANKSNREDWEKTVSIILTDLYNGWSAISSRIGVYLIMGKSRTRPVESTRQESLDGFISKERADNILRELQTAASVSVTPSTDRPGQVLRDDVRSVLKETERVIVKYLWTLK